MSWEMVRIKDITINLDNKRKPLNESERNKISKKQLYPYIGANNIMGFVDEFLFDEEIICIAEDGGSWGENQKCCVYTTEKCWVNNHAHVLGSNNRADLKYLMYYLNATDLNKYITGSTRGKLTKSALDSIQVPLPPLSTQKRIAEILDAADALRRKDQELLKKYDELAQAIFIDMFGDPVRNEMGWEVKKLGEFGKISTGNTPPRAVPENYNSNFIEWIKTDNIEEESIYVSTANEYLSENGVKKGRTTPAGSLLVACIAGSIDSIGRSALTDREVTFNQQINSIEPNENVNSFFLYYLIKNCRKHIQNQASNGMKRMLSKGEFEKIKMILPNLKLQIEFEKKAKLLVVQKEKMKNAKNTSENLFNSLIQKAFKGELVQ